MSAQMMRDGPATAEVRLRPRLTTVEASRYFAEHHGVTVAVATLEKLRCIGGGPTFRHFGRAVRYELSALDSYVASKLGQPKASTSDGSAT